MLKRLTLLFLVSMILVACSQILNPDANLRTFDEVLRHESHSMLFLEDESGFDVTIQWTILKDWNEDWVTFLHVYDAEGELVAQDEFLPNPPDSEDTIILNYSVRPPETGFVLGEYSVEIGWYADQTLQERLLLAKGTDSESDTLQVSTFSVNSEGEIILPTLEIESDS